MKKKTMAWLLCISLVLSFMPITAQASTAAVKPVNPTNTLQLYGCTEQKEDIFIEKFDRFNCHKVTVTFTAGEHGSLTGTEEFKVQKGSQWKEVITVPTPVPDAGYRFNRWEPELPSDTDTINENVTYTASFKKKSGGKTPAVSNEKTTPEVLNGIEHFSYIVGSDDGLIHPEQNITRAEVATIFFRLLKDEVRNEKITVSNNFSDVNKGDWYNTAISTMASMGIIKGYEDGSFQPNTNITRAEFSAIAERFDGGTAEIKTEFTDIKGHWGYNEISRAYELGWINGYPDGTFKPDNCIIRAEVVTVINRVLNRKVETESDMVEGMKTWPDNADKEKWYYLDIQEAANSHEYNLKENGYEKWIKLTSNPDWTAFEN